MLAEVLEGDLVIAELKSKKKEDVIKEMADKFVEAGIVKDENRFIEAIKEREGVETTAIGNGIAIPHARSDTVEGLSVVLAKSEEGIDFQAVDGKPVQLIFMIACSVDISKGYLQILARIARLCKNYAMKDGLIKAKDEKEIMNLIRGFDAGSGKLEDVKLKSGRTVYSNKAV